MKPKYKIREVKDSKDKSDEFIVYEMRKRILFFFYISDDRYFSSRTLAYKTCDDLNKNAKN